MDAFRAPLNLALLAATLILAGIGFALIAPDAVIPVRWGLDLAPSDYAPRNRALLEMPGATILVWAVCWAFLRFGSELRREGNIRTVRVALPIVTGLFLALQLAIVLAGLRG